MVCVSLFVGGASGGGGLEGALAEVDARAVHPGLEDADRGDLVGFDLVGVRVQDDEVGALADLEAAELGLATECSGAVQGVRPQRGVDADAQVVRAGGRCASPG
jgi:hypothetical protein